MSQVRVSIGCVTLVFGREMLHVSVDDSRLDPATHKPVLHERGLRAEHLTVPFKPLARGPRAGKYWVHLTYPDGVHKDVAILDPDDLRSVSQAIESAFKEALGRQLRAQTVEINAEWLTERDLKLVFMIEDEFPGWADTHFKRGRRHYRVSPERMQKSAGDMWVAEPEILDDEDFILRHPKVLQAVSFAEDSKRYFVWRFPWGPGGSWGWYATVTEAVAPVRDAQFLKAVLGCLKPGFWDAIRTILIELGIPMDYESLDRHFRELQAGRADFLLDLRASRSEAA
jgi:hypothetical protein